MSNSCKSNSQFESISMGKRQTVSEIGAVVHFVLLWWQVAVKQIHIGMTMTGAQMSITKHLSVCLEMPQGCHERHCGNDIIAVLLAAAAHGVQLTQNSLFRKSCQSIFFHDTKKSQGLFFLPKKFILKTNSVCGLMILPVFQTWHE